MQQAPDKLHFLDDMSTDPAPMVSDPTKQGQISFRCSRSEKLRSTCLVAEGDRVPSGCSRHESLFGSRHSKVSGPLASFPFAFPEDQGLLNCSCLNSTQLAGASNAQPTRTAGEGEGGGRCWASCWLTWSRTSPSIGRYCSSFGAEVLTRA